MCFIPANYLKVHGMILKAEVLNALEQPFALSSSSVPMSVLAGVIKNINSAEKKGQCQLLAGPLRKSPLGSYSVGTLRTADDQEAGSVPALQASETSMEWPA